MRTKTEEAGQKTGIGLRRACDESGFTYLALLAVVAVTGILLATAGEVWHTTLQREKEQELLFVGDQFRRAFNLYSQHAHDNSRRYPLSLEELLKDPRSPGVTRYLRKIYPDPISGSRQWGLIKGPNGEIFGIHSLSEDEPLKKSGFSLADLKFEGRTRYADWVFMDNQGPPSGKLLKRP